MSNTESRRSIGLSILIGVLLAVSYDTLQELFKWWMSQHETEPYLSVLSKSFGGAITLLAGAVIILVLYKKN